MPGESKTASQLWNELSYLSRMSWYTGCPDRAARAYEAQRLKEIKSAVSLLPISLASTPTHDALLPAEGGSPTTALLYNKPKTPSICKVRGIITLSTYLAICRALSAVVSAYALYESINSTAKTAGADMDDPKQKYSIMAISIFFSLSTFIGMASSSFFAQGFRLKQTTDEYLAGKFSVAHIPFLLLASTTVYSLIIGYMSKSAVVGFTGKFTNAQAVNIAAQAFGAVIGFGYFLLTLNYMTKSIEGYREKKHNAETFASVTPRPSQSAGFWFGNVLPQLAINAFIFGNGIHSDGGPAWGDPINLIIIAVLSAATIPAIYDAQIGSFVANTRKEEGGVKNIFKTIVKHHAGLPSEIQNGCEKTLLNFNVVLCNFAVAMMAPSNANAILQILLASGVTAMVARGPYFATLGVMMLPTIMNAGSYMAFNTQDGKLAFAYFTLTHKLPTKQQMNDLKWLLSMEDQKELDKLSREDRNKLTAAWRQLRQQSEVTRFKPAAPPGEKTASTTPLMGRSAAAIVPINDSSLAVSA